MAVAMATVCSIGSVQAQPGGRGGQGMGMMGGMMGPMAGLAVLGTPEGKAELKITEEQAAKLQALQENLRSGMMERFQAIQDLPEDERRGKTESAMKEVADGMKKDLKTVLNADQFKRFEQITTQAQGFQAFSLPEVQKALTITDAQKEAIEKIQQENMAAMRDAFQASQGDREAAMKAMTEIRNKSMEKAKALLSAEQKSQWEEMVGKPFQMPQGGLRRRPQGNN